MMLLLVCNWQQVNKVVVYHIKILELQYKCSKCVTSTGHPFGVYGGKCIRLISLQECKKFKCYALVSQ